MGVQVDTRPQSLLIPEAHLVANKQRKREQPTLVSGQRKFIQAVVERRIGPLPFRARYHCAPKLFDSDYRLTGEVLGSGVSGDIVAAEPCSRNDASSCYAVKRLGLEGIPDWKLAEVRREVAISLCMDHPHVSRLHDVYEEDSQLLLVFERLSGGELYDRLVQKERFPEEEAQDVIHQIVLMMAYIHGAQRVAHRDVKLENLVYASAGGRTLKIIDFGLATFALQGRPMRAQCGTLQYTSPEVLRGSYTTQCDIWSVGVVAYILLSGTMPFRGSKSSVLQGTFQMHSDVWKGLSQDSRNFVREMLQVEPCNRPNAQAALGHVWMQRHTAHADLESWVRSSLRDFPTIPKLRRICLRMMSLLLSAADRATFIDTFLALDLNCQGTIPLASLEQVLASNPSANVKAQQGSCSEALAVWTALQSCRSQEDGDSEVHLSEFVAAVLQGRGFSDTLLRSTFERFDTNGTGNITAQSLCAIIGDSLGNDEAASMLREASNNGTECLCYGDFVTYLGCSRAAEPITSLEFSEALHSCNPCSIHTDTPDARDDYPPGRPFKRMDGDRAPASRSCCGDVDVDASCVLQ